MKEIRLSSKRRRSRCRTARAERAGLAVTGRGRARLPAALLGEPGGTAGTAERCAALWARGRLPGTEAVF